MLVKAASHLRPILRLQGLLQNSSAASTTTSTSFTSSANTANTVSQAFSSNANLLVQAQVQAGQAQIATVQQGGNFVGAAWGLGSGSAGSGPGTGSGSGAGGKFSGYTGFGRTLTQAPQTQTASQNQDGDDDLEQDPRKLADNIRARRPSITSRISTVKASPKRQSSKLVSRNPTSPSSVSRKDLVEEDTVKDPDSDVEVERKEHRLRRRASGTTTESVPAAGLWTVGLRGGKFVRLPLRLGGVLPVHIRGLTSMSVLKPGQTSVDDLEMIAGRREGIRRVRQFGATQRVRRNSTSAVERSSRPLGEAYESVEQDSGKQSLKPITKAELSLAEAELRDKLEAQDRTAYIEIKRAIENRDRKTALRLVDEYRNPLALHSDPAISTADNVNPPYFTQAGYNIAIIALHRFRDPGEPITEILKTYNEMLERDVLPNIKTYSLVIRSLMERHDEVQSATRNAWGRRRWIEWDRARARSFKKEGLGISNYQYADRHQALLPIETQIEALKKENNYENALRLFHSGVLYNRHRTFQPQVYAHLMSAAAKKGDLQTVLQVWGHLEGANKRTQQTNDASFDTRPLAILYSYLIEAYAKAPEGGVDGMQDILKKFLTDEKNGHIRDGRSSDGSLEYPLIDDTGMPVLDAEGNPRMTVMSDGVDIMRAVVKFFDSLLYGYAYLGETEKVDALLDLMRKTTREEEKRAGHLAQVNSSAVMNICRGYWDRKDYNRALEVLEKIKTEKGASHIRRAATEMVLDAIAESNVDVVASLAKLTERDQPFFEFTCLRRAITLLVFEFDRADLPTERTKDLIQTIELLASSWPKNTKWNVDAHTLSAICEQATKVDMLQDAYAVLQKSIACGNVLPSHGGIKAYDVLSPIFEAKQTLEGKIEVIALARRCQVDLRQGQVLPVISKLAEALSNNSTTVKTLVDQIGQSGLQAFLQVLCKLGDKSGRPLLGDEAAAFDENLVKIVKSLGSLRVSNDLLEDDQRLIVLLLDERLGTTAARPIAEEAFGTELVASLDVHVESPGQTSSVLSDAPTRMFETASEASTRPTELSEGTEAPRKWEVPFNLTKEVDGHHGRNPTLTPIQAYSILKRNEAEGRLPSPAAIGRLAVALSRLGFADKVAELYKLAHQAVPCLREDRQLGAWYEIENNMISACCLLGQLEQAGFHRAAILEQGQVPSADAYATMIASAKDTTDDASVARELWEESQRLGVQPNLYLYNTIISKLSRARKAEMALEFFKRMKSEQIKPSSVTYGAVINACCRVGDDQSATTLFEEMQAQPNHKPRVPPYNTMMQLHLQTHPSRELVLHYYNQMVQAEVAPSAHTYKLLLDAYGNLPPVDLPAMQQVFENLCNDSRVAVAGTHWASMIHAAGISAGDAKKACEIFDSIATHRSSQYLKTIEPVCWEALMHVLAEHKMIDEMDAYRGKMTEQDAKPTAYVNNMLIKGYANVGLIEKSRAIFESMSDSGTGMAAPNNHPVLMTSSGQAKPTTTADTKLVYREPSTYEAMIRAELSAGTRDAAQIVCDQMEARMYPIAVTTRIRSLVDDSAASSPSS